MPSSLTQGRRANTSAGEPTFQPFAAFDEAGLSFRRSQLTLVAAGPGCGKSALVQYMLTKGYKGLAVNRVLYFSADTDAATMFIRSCAMLTGWESSYIEGRLRGDEGVEELEAIVNGGAGHMQMVFKSYPTSSDVDSQVLAYEEVWGVLPDVIVMDNAKNMDMEMAGEDHVLLEEACEYLHELARATNAAVITLHHVEGKYEGSDMPIPLSGLRGKIGKTPETVLTLHRSGTNLHVSPVKYRNGDADPGGKKFITLTSDLSRMQFG